MFTAMAIVGVLLLALSIGFLAYILRLYSTHDAEVAAERAQAGLGPAAATSGATPLVGAFLALGGVGIALGSLLLVASQIVRM